MLSKSCQNKKSGPTPAPSDSGCAAEGMHPARSEAIIIQAAPLSRRCA